MAKPQPAYRAWVSGGAVERGATAPWLHYRYHEELAICKKENILTL